MEFFILATPDLSAAEQEFLGQALVDHVEAFLDDVDWRARLTASLP